ncbi:hypothetical protein GCM10029992_08990 [Glycomyces albus]
MWSPRPAYAVDERADYDPSPDTSQPPETGGEFSSPPEARTPSGKTNGREISAATRLALASDLMRGRSILWVDDHMSWNDSLRNLFITTGMTVDRAVTTETGLNMTRRHHYDLIITDMKRDTEPAGDRAGIALLDGLAALGRRIPAIVYTGNVDPRLGIPHGALAVIDDPNELVHLVVDVMERLHRESQAR